MTVAAYPQTPPRTFWGPTGMSYLALLEVANDTTNNWTPAVQADVFSVTYSIYLVNQQTGGKVSVGSGTFVVSDVVLNVPSTGTIGEGFNTGFNVKAKFARSLFAVAGIYEIVMTFTLTSVDSTGAKQIVYGKSRPTFADPAA